MKLYSTNSVQVYTEIGDSDLTARRLVAFTKLYFASASYGVIGIDDIRPSQSQTEFFYNMDNEKKLYLKCQRTAGSLIVTFYK